MRKVIAAQFGVKPVFFKPFLEEGQTRLTTLQISYYHLAKTNPGPDQMTFFSLLSVFFTGKLVGKNDIFPFMYVQ